VVTVRDGMVVRWQSYWDRTEALEPWGCGCSQGPGILAAMSESFAWSPLIAKRRSRQCGRPQGGVPESRPSRRARPSAMCVVSHTSRTAAARYSVLVMAYENVELAGPGMGVLREA
jgi:hypothetical protein